MKRKIKWLTIDSSNPFVVLTLEEMLLRDNDIQDDIVYFYQNNNAVIIGRNQNAYDEVNLDYCRDHDVKIYRRISGGGAVYHDLGNINFSYITHSKGSYETFLKPVIEFFKSLGLNAEFVGRNDIQIDGYKVSGNAQYATPNRMVHHGTIIFDVNLDMMKKTLKVNPLKLESKAIKSIRKRVMPIKQLLNNTMEIKEFITKLISFFIEKYDAEKLEVDYAKYALQWAELISQRASQKWIFGKSPEFKVVNEAKFDGGIMKVSYNVENSVFTNFKFEGDYLSMSDTEFLNDILVGLNYSKDEVISKLKMIDLVPYFGSISMDNIINLIFGDSKNESN